MAKLGMRLVFINIVMNPLAEMTYGKNNLRISKLLESLHPTMGNLATPKMSLFFSFLSQDPT